jgi:lipase
VQLATTEWGDPGDPTIVCLHGVQAHGRRYRRLAEERLVPLGFHVLAADLRGHGRSSWDPPWSIPTHRADVIELAETIGPTTWIGHSFGGRLVLELAAARPELVERAVLLDPAIYVEPPAARAFSESERADRSFADADELVRIRSEDARLAPRAFLEEEAEAHTETGADGRLRFRYAQAAAGTMFAELATPPPPAPTCPTLIVVAQETEYTTPDDVARLRDGLGERLTVAEVPGDHIVLWDAFEETAGAIERFLAETG